MAEPTTKIDLLRRVASANEELEGTLAELTADEIARPGTQEALSVKDILAHLAWWERHAGDMLRAASLGTEIPYVQQPGEDSSAMMDRVNAEVYDANRDRPLPEVMAEFHAAHQHLLEEISNLSEEQIFSPQGLAQVLGGSVLDLIAGNSYGHYEEHLTPIKALLRQRSSS